MIKLEYMFNTIAFMWIEILINFCMAVVTLLTAG